MRYLFIISILLLTACQDVKRPEKPVDLIPEDQMVDILTDVYLGNAAKSVNNRIIRQKGVKLDSFVYVKHGIDSLRFVTSNAYYTSQLNTYNDLFQRVEERLNRIQKEMDSIQKAKGADLKDKTEQRREKTKPSVKVEKITPVQSETESDSIE